MKTENQLPLYEGGSNGRAYAEYIIRNNLYENHKTVEDYEQDLVTIPHIMVSTETTDVFWLQFLSHMEDENLYVAL